MGADSGRQPWARTFEEELAEIRRRHGNGVEADRLVGLALSGGGMRSAIFSLGVLEELKRFGVLTRIHYLSTVSSGAHIGAWLSANCRRAAHWLAPATDWTESVVHVRRHSRSETSAGQFLSVDTWSGFSTWIQNTLLAQGTMTFAIACTLLLLLPFLEIFLNWPAAGNLRWAAVLLPLLGILGVVGNLLSLNVVRSAPLRRQNAIRGLAGASVCFAATWAYGRNINLDPLRSAGGSYAGVLPVAVLLVIAGVFLLPVAVALASATWRGGDAPERMDFTDGWVQGVVVIPLMTTAYLLAAALWGESQRTGAPGFADYDTFGAFFSHAWRHWPFPLSVLFAVFWLLAFCSIRDRTSRRALTAACAAPFVTVPVIYTEACAFMLLLHGWASLPTNGLLRAFVFGPPLIALGFTLGVLVFTGMLGREATAGTREWLNRMGAWLSIYGAIWMTLAAVALFVPPLVDRMVSEQPATSLTAAGLWIWIVFAGVRAARSATTGGTATRTVARKVLETVAALAPVALVAGHLVIVAVAIARIVVLNAGSPWLGGFSATLSLVMLAGSVLMLVMLAARFDINEASLNTFYRNRLVRGYLGATRFRPGERRPANFTGFDELDELRLADVSPEPGSRAPLHLINAALHLGSARQLIRRRASFTLSALHCGSGYRIRTQLGDTREMGYVATAEYGGPSGSLSLGQAMTVSGAGGDPGMSYHVWPMVSFLMTMFAARLGWWLPNPSMPVRTLSPYFGLSYLVAELFGATTATSKFVMVSDGGHFDDLAIYELVRRRCRVIIAIDAGSDPELIFDGLVRVIGMCKEDFSARIEIDLNALRPEAESGWSRDCSSIGTVRYSDGTTGVFIYLKAAMTGQEDTAVRQYKASHPAFPHDRPSDQFDDDSQFESYRQLGHDVARQALANVMDADDTAIDRGVLGTLGLDEMNEEQLGVPADFRERIHARRRATAAGIFISYRREDSSGYALSLYDRLVARFGESRVFMDIDSIEPGRNFVEVVHEKLNSCRALVVVIGRHWLKVTDQRGGRRLSRADDWVRIEIATAIARKIEVIPLLVANASMPTARDLPADLRPLVTYQAIPVSDVTFRQGIDRLIQALE